MAKDSDWSREKTRWDRLKWARLAAGYGTAKEAFEAFGWDSIDTYRSHERPPRGKSHGFDEDWGQRYARAFHVDWIWLMHGTGVPYPKKPAPTPADEEWDKLPPEAKAKALRLLKAADS